MCVIKCVSSLGLSFFVLLYLCYFLAFLPKAFHKMLPLFSPSFSKRSEKRFQLFGIRGNNPLMLLLGFPHLSCGLQYVEPYGIPVIVNWCYVNKNESKGPVKLLPCSYAEFLKSRDALT